MFLGKAAVTMRGQHVYRKLGLVVQKRVKISLKSRMLGHIQYVSLHSSYFEMTSVSVTFIRTRCHVVVLYLAPWECMAERAAQVRGRQLLFIRSV